MNKKALFASPKLRFGGKLFTRRLPKGSEGLFLALSYHIMELEIHLYRIDDHATNLTDAESNNADITTRLELMADVHSYVIAWTNISKTFDRLLKVVNDKDFMKIYNKRKSWFSRMRKVRNHLEHLDERVTRDGGPQNTPQILYIPSEKASTAVILGVRVEIRRRANDRLFSLLEDLDLWLDSQPEKSNFGRS